MYSACKDHLIIQVSHQKLVNTSCMKIISATENEKHNYDIKHAEVHVIISLTFQ